MSFSWDTPYTSQRSPVLARNVVATSQPLAAQAGLRMLMRGGNAVDAAVAAAIALTIVEPTSNGIGGDAFAIVWDGHALHGLNGSGRSPAAWTADRFAGRTSMPQRGWDSVTVPGAVDAWAVLSRRFGRLDFGQLFEPAIRYARDGFAVSPIIAEQWQRAAPEFSAFAEFGRVFLPDGRAPAAGEIFRFRDAAETLQAIAESSGESFYRGELAGRIARQSEADGGAVALDDLADHRSEWVEPLAQAYRRVRLHELPPNGQGLAALMALGMLSKHDLAGLRADSADSLHLQVEAMKLSFAEAHRHVAEPAAMQVSFDAMLDPEFLAGRARTIHMDRAGQPGAVLPPDRGTVYLAAADAGGMMVSFIQSNYLGFGSGIVVPGTGISLQNRGHGFSLEPGHPNCVAGGKRPFHTIIPGFVTQQGRPLMSLGVMGGHMQPQGHVQMMVRLFDYGQNPQAALDAPRWQVLEDGRLALEPGIADAVKDELSRRGHTIVDRPVNTFGGGQLIYRLDDGYCAASEPRKDGQAVGY